jgi:peptidoglycan/LPS O-acetylase OafA/YrhL
MPSPYPPRPAFRPVSPPPPPSTGGRPDRTAAPRPQPQPTETWEGVGFRPDIQGLRAVAVLLVLLSHVGFGFAAGGYVGVDVFFVVSGFLITALLVKEVFDTGKISIVGFYARRARRILPVASVVTMATALGAWLWFPVTRLEAVMQDAYTVIVYVVNYRFVSEQTEYLNAGQMPSPLQQFWSLAVEEQFYIVWPLLLIGLMFLVGRSPRKLVGAAVGACIAIFAISLVLSVIVTEQSQPTAYYAAHTRIWELAAGAFLALVLPALKRTPKVLGLILGIAGLAAIIGSALLYDDATAFPGYTALLPVVGTMLVIVAGSGPATGPASALLSTGPFQFVGKISYSLYLWHWPILILLPLGLDVENSLLLNTVLIVLTFAIAQLSYACIEQPVRNARLLKADNRWGIATGVVCSMLGLAMIVTLTTAFSKVPDDSGPVDLDTVEQVEDFSAVEAGLAEGLAIERVPATAIPPLAGMSEDLPEIYRSDPPCHLTYERTTPPEDCVFGDVDSETVVVLLGDSHAAQWFPALESIATDKGWKLLSRTKSGCSPVSITVMNTVEDTVYTGCDEWRAHVLDEIDEIAPAMVVIGNSDNVVFADPAEDTAGQWRDGWRETLSRVTASAGAVVTMADTPRAQGTSAPDCLSTHMDSVQSCLTEHPYVLSDQDLRTAGLEAQREAGSTHVETTPWFCADGRCPLIVDEMFVYRDEHHITTPYSRALAGVLAGSLPPI